MPGLVDTSRHDWPKYDCGLEIVNGGSEVILRVDALWYTDASMNLVMQSIQNDLANRYITTDFRNPRRAPIDGRARINIGYKLWHFDQGCVLMTETSAKNIIGRIRQLLLPLNTRTRYQDQTLCEIKGDISTKYLTIEKEQNYATCCVA